MIGNLDKLDSTVVTCLSYPHWVEVWVSAMLLLLASFDCYCVTYVVRVWSPFSILMLIVLNYKPLLTFFNKLPVCLK